MAVGVGEEGVSILHTTLFVTQGNGRAVDKQFQEETPRGIFWNYTRSHIKYPATTWELIIKVNLQPAKYKSAEESAPSFSGEEPHAGTLTRRVKR